MDFDSRFDCCKACNSVSVQYPNNRSPGQIQGQGDCKCNSDGNKNAWLTMDKGKKLRSKLIRDRKETESTAGRQKDFMDGHCYCFSKPDFPDKVKREPKQEKNDFGNFEKCNYFWESPGFDSKPKSDTFFMAEQKRVDFNNPDKALAENILEFEEKVDFLFRIFKDYGQKFPLEGYIQQSQTKSAEGIFKEVDHLFEFNKRLCAAEEGIEKLALILEDLVKASSKKAAEDNYNDPVDFDDMSVSERISYLKSRNDLMLSFMKAFFKPGSAEEYYSKLALLPCGIKSTTIKMDHAEKRQTKDLDRVRIMETLQKLRTRMNEVRQKKCQLFNDQHSTRIERKGETALKCVRNKLEVISEQAELALSDESETALDEKNAIRILSEKLSEVNDESDESDLSVQDVTFSMLAQEAEFMKPPSDKLLFSKLDLPDKKFGNGSNTSLKEDNQGDGALSYDSSSELNFFFFDAEKTEKPRDRNKISVYQAKPKEFKEPIKKEKGSLEKGLKDNGCKQNGSKKGEDFVEGNVQPGRKVLQEDCFLVFPSKTNRTGCSVPELCRPERCSSSREERKRELKKIEQRQRPMTDPNCHRKPFPPTTLKPPLPDKCRTKNSGINTVKSKNKILLSKKSCVQPS